MWNTGGLFLCIWPKALSLNVSEYLHHSISISACSSHRYDRTRKAREGLLDMRWWLSLIGHVGLTVSFTSLMFKATQHNRAPTPIIMMKSLHYITDLFWKLMWISLILETFWHWWWNWNYVVVKHSAKKILTITCVIGWIMLSWMPTVFPLRICISGKLRAWT